MANKGKKALRASFSELQKKVKTAQIYLHSTDFRKKGQFQPKINYQFAFEISAINAQGKVAGFAPQALIERGIKIGDGLIQSTLKQLLDDAMESKEWGWQYGDGITQRKNGELAYGIRNIVDTGVLKESLRMNIDQGFVNVAYREPYALITHFGGYVQPYGNPNARPVYLPPRPWVAFTLTKNEGKIKKIYRDAIRNQFD